MKKAKCKNIVESYDALVMVHPDYTKPVNNNYEQNLQDIIRTFNSMRKPVFIAPPIKTERMRKYLSDAIIIPINHPECYQKDVDFIAKHIGKAPQDIKLAFGGTYARACVYAYATSWCKVVETNHVGKFRQEPPANPIKYGKVLEEIV